MKQGILVHDVGVAYSTMAATLRLAGVKRGSTPTQRSPLTDDATKEANGGATMLALEVGQQRLENHAHVHQALLASLREEEEIVAVDLHKTF